MCLGEAALDCSIAFGAHEELVQMSNVGHIHDAISFCKLISD